MISKRRTYQDGELVAEMDITIPDEVPNRATISGRAEAALAANATFLALPNPTNAQNVAQVQRLTRECSALIRLLIGRLEDTTGT